MTYLLENVDAAVAMVRQQKTDAGRYVVIARILAGQLNYTDPHGKALGSRRALFCSKLSVERLWPDKKT